MELKAWNFVLKPNNNQKKTKTAQKPLNRVSRHGFIQSRPGVCAIPLCTFAQRAEISFSLLRFYNSTLLQYYSYYVLH